MILALEGFWLIFVSLIVFILIIGVIIVVHEFGHFLVARKAGILCHEFSIGMGPCIYKHQFKNTLFCLRAIPIGGYVQMADDEVSQFLTKGDKVGLILDDDEVVKIQADFNMYADVKGVVQVFKLATDEDTNMYITLETEEGNEEILGKPVGNDKAKGKCTYVSKYGIEGAKEKLNKITEEAIEELKIYEKKAEFLNQLAFYIKDRNK